MTAVAVRVRVLAHGEDLPLPENQTERSSGLDLRAAISGAIEIRPGQRIKVPTGIAIEVPSGWEGQVRPRSGLAIRHGITLLNSPGTIDSDYRGEVAVILVNLGDEKVTIQRADRIAQIVFAPVAAARLIRVDLLESSDRGEGGFGSTGSL